MTRDGEDRQPVSLWQTITSVLAAFFGVQSSANRARDFARTNPLLFFLVALALSGVFILVLAGIAKLVTGRSQETQAVAPRPHVASPSPQIARAVAPVESLDTLAQRVLPCAACHGEQGRATPDGYYPRIAGKPAGYLFNQLVNFRDGRRNHEVMSYLVDRQRDDYLREIAQHFAGLHLPYPVPASVPADAEQLERGRALVRSGDRALQVPACADCHGERLTGVAPAIPGLVGLPRDYLVAQFGAWELGARRAQAPDCMGEIARRLGAADIAAVTAWLATQPVPADSRPAAATSRELPLKCGGVSGGNVGGATDQIAQGRYLALAGDCMACHTQRGGPPYAGGRAIPTPFGTFYSPNITPDPETGIGHWSADDFWRALHEGRSRDGAPLYPVFPYTNYTQIAREDSDALFAYLKTVAPAQQVRREHALRFPYQYRALLLGWRALYFRPGTFEADARQSAEWNRGAYLVRGLGHCSACHESRNALGAIQSKDNPAGGLVLSWYAPSLYSAAEAGAQGQDAGQLAELLHAGKTAGAAMLGPMAEVVFESLQHLTREDTQAMAQYLVSLPERGRPGRSGRPPPSARQLPVILDRGAKIYAEHCASCHGDEGEGLPPAGPHLAGNRAVTQGSAVNLIRVLRFGGYPPGTADNPRPFGMPPFGETLDDAEIAAVLSYLRTSWGHDAGAVSAAEVSRHGGGPLW